MSKTFSFDTPIHLYKVNGLGKKPTSLGFFNSYVDAQNEQKRLGLNALEAGIDNDIKGRFFECGIFDEKVIRDRMSAAYECAPA